MTAGQLFMYVPGTTVDGVRFEDGDCPAHLADRPIAWMTDLGNADDAVVCGLMDDDDRMCAAAAAYTAWLDTREGDQPVTLCTRHGEAARRWPSVVRMHTARPAGATAPWGCTHVPQHHHYHPADPAGQHTEETR